MKVIELLNVLMPFVVIAVTEWKVSTFTELSEPVAILEIMILLVCVAWGGLSVQMYELKRSEDGRN